MSLETRLNKIKGKIKPQPAIIILKEGEEITQEQQAQLAKSKAAGLEPLVIRVVRASRANQGAPV